MFGIEEMLEQMTIVFSQKEIPDIDLVIKLEINPMKQAWYLTVQSGKLPKLSKTINVASQVTFTLSEKTLRKIFKLEWTGLTSIARENLHDISPLNFSLAPGVKMDEKMLDQLYLFVQHYFNSSIPEAIVLDKHHARIVHGAYAIPMYYHSGFRSAWYQIEKGQKLNKPGDTNPFPQAFVIVSGQGYAKIGEIILKIQSGRTYYVPPFSEHIFWTDDSVPLCLIYLAWGENA